MYMNYEQFKKTNINENKTKKSYIVIDAINDNELYDLFHKINTQYNAGNLCKKILCDELQKIKL